MKIIRRFLFTASIVGLMSFSAIPAVYADNPVDSVCNDQNITAGNASSSALCQDTSTSQFQGSSTVVDLIANIISAVAGFAAVVIIVISGIQYITSGGDSKKISQAKDSIIYSSVGLIIIVLARILISFVLTKTG